MDRSPSVFDALILSGDDNIEETSVRAIIDTENKQKQ
jgi:hypothetical protein